jgi:regulator of sirC expression with transglutaminase-like and TPR domain
MKAEAAREQFIALIKLPEHRIDLARGALLIAAEDSPNLDINQELDRLDQMAEQVAPSVAAAEGDFAKVNALHCFLFEEFGLRGNHKDYRDPRNCLLNEVLDRRLGIPLTLSIVQLEIARRVDIPLEGVNFPSHFLVRHKVQRHMLFDPYDGGTFLTTLECVELLERKTEGLLPFNHDLLRSATRLQMLERLLNNLRTTYVTRGHVVNALTALERLLLINPGDLTLRRDLGLLLLQYGEMAAGIEEIEHYLDETLEPPDRQKLEELLDQAKKNILPIQ